MKPDVLKRDSLLRRWSGPLSRETALEGAGSGLGKVPSRLKPEDTATLVCGYCSVGCGLRVHLENGRAINLSASPEYPVNLGLACPKGWEALSPLAAPDRAITPLLRNEKTGSLEPVDWETAFAVFTDRFKDIQRRHGPGAAAWLGTGQITNEELALLGSLAKFGMGMLHGDGNTRQCMATAVTAYKECFGFDAPPYSFTDLDHSDVLIFIGANPAIAHPILWHRVFRNPNRPEIVVVDPRRTESAQAATRHVALRPRSDLLLLYGLAHVLIINDWIQRDFIAGHTRGFDAFARHVREFTPDKVAAGTGVTVGELWRLAKTIHAGRAVSFWWTMGVNQGHEATRTAQAIIALALITGNIGRPGTGPNSITGQCNAMGSRLFSNTTNLLGGHDFKNSGHRRKIAGVLGLDPSRVPAEDSLAYDQILAGVDAGKIKALWVVATNTAHSWIHQSSARDTLARLEFLVVQDMYPNTETARAAHLVLPAAAWGEKDGTFINSERRIGLIRSVAKPPGLALSDFDIFRGIARHWGCGKMFERWTSPEAAFQILKQVSAGQPCDITGIRDYAMLDACGGVQWPFPEANQPARGTTLDRRTASHPVAGPSLPASPPQHRRLFEDGRFFTPDGRARFVFAHPQPLPEPTDAEYPMTLLTGRGTSAQWHTQTRTGKSAVLRKLYPAGLYLELNPDDAARLGIGPRDHVTVSSRRGRVMARVFITPTVAPGQVFLPMHYEDTNRLTFPVVDPHSRQPGYKSCAVKIERSTRGSNASHGS